MPCHVPSARRPLDQRDGQLRLRERGADVRGHIVGTLGGVPVPGRVFGREPLEELVEIADHVGIGILLDGERRRGVLDERGQQTGTEAVSLRSSAPLRR